MAKPSFWALGTRATAPETGLLKNLTSLAKRKGSDVRSSDAMEALLLMRNYEDCCHGWFWSTDSEGRLTYISDSIAGSLNDQDTSSIGSRFADAFELAEDDLSGRRTLSFILAKQSQFEKITLRATVDGDQRYWSASGSPQFDQSNRFTGYRGSAVDVTEQRRVSEQAAQLAKYDSLTGLPNRRRMSEVLDVSLVGAEHHGKSCAVILIDLDRFKQVNDTLGHPAGDVLLKQVAERLSRIVGDREMAFRIGGDEFQVIIKNVDDRVTIGDMAAEIIASLSQPHCVEGNRCIIGASVGIAVAPSDGLTRSELMRNADLALYASKSAGRGCFRFFSKDLLRTAEDKRTLEEDLRDALPGGQLSLTYQPIVDSTANRITGVEALLRWHHPSRGPISPTVFIPIAEEIGLIVQFGEWVLRKACEDASTWPGKLRVAVNVSPIQFTNASLPSTVLSALAQSGLSPERLELEITEGVFLGESPTTDMMFQALKEIGVRLVLDDFGTGYSSLGYLQNAPFDKIKIDQTFVRAATMPESRNRAIIAAIVALAEALDMETTAEGVEFMDQLDLIRRLRVSHVQGWLYGKAMSSDELNQRLKAEEWLIEPSGPARQRSDRQTTYRKAGVIHDNRYDDIIMRNLSESGALIEGVDELRVGALILVDFGDGHLTLARVNRSQGRQYGIAFEQQLVDDGSGGFSTSQRVSPYLLATSGLPSRTGENESRSRGKTALPLEDLAKRLGLPLAPNSSAGAPSSNLNWSSDLPKPRRFTFNEIAERYLEAIEGDGPGLSSAKRDIQDHILPKFGRSGLDQVSRAEVFAWLAAKEQVEGEPPGTDRRLHSLLGQMLAFAVEQKLVGADANPLQGSFRFDRGGESEAVLTATGAEELLQAACASQNRQLKFILSLLMLTGARPGEILDSKWEQFDLAAGVWRLPGIKKVRELHLSGPAVALIGGLLRWAGCPYLVPNPVTKRPYQSITRSWQVARDRAGLPQLEIDDLRYCDLGAAHWEGRLLDVVRDLPPDADLKSVDGALPCRDEVHEASRRAA